MTESTVTPSFNLSHIFDLIHLSCWTTWDLQLLGLFGPPRLINGRILCGIQCLQSYRMPVRPTCHGRNQDWCVITLWIEWCVFVSFGVYKLNDVFLSGFLSIGVWCFLFLQLTRIFLVNWFFILILSGMAVLMEKKRTGIQHLLHNMTLDIKEQSRWVQLKKDIYTIDNILGT